MTNKEIEQLWKRATNNPNHDSNWYEPAVVLFAKLVADSEREAIARMIEDAPPLVDFCKNDQNGCMVCGFTPKLAAAAIRARGQA